MRGLLHAGSGLLGACILSLLPWLGKAEPAEVYLVLGSDTAIWEGMDVTRFNCHYNLGLYTNTTRNAYQVMAPDFRARFADSYGQTVKLTWWMMAGQIFRYADNTDVPVPNTMTLHLMKQLHGAAMTQFGDELTLHYHTFAWTNYSGGSPQWTQANSFLECKDDFDFTVAQFLLEEATYPVSFRSGWEWMDTDWQNHLNQVLPFSLEANWGADWQPYHPSTNDYRVAGSGKGWNTRCTYMANISQAQMNSLFAAAAGGASQVACLWAHLPETDFLTNISNVDAKAQLAAQSYPGVKFRYCTAVEAMQRWLGYYGEQPPFLTVAEERTNNLVLSIRSDKPIFQQQPFVAYKDIYNQTRIAECAGMESNAWRVPLPLPVNGISEVAIAVTDDYGNLATNFLKYTPIPPPPPVPPDYEVIVDNSQALIAGNWITGSSSADKYRSNYLYTTTQGTGAAQIRFAPILANDAIYNVYEWHPQGLNRTTNAPYVIRYSGGQETIYVNQQTRGGEWNLLGRWHFAAGQSGDVTITDAFPDTGKVVLADAIRFVLPTATKPAILSPPVSRTVEYGEPIEFSVLATTGSAPVTYQWRLGETPIPGATTASHILSGAQTLDAGSYDVIVQNAAGAVTSSPALLVVNPPVAPAIFQDPHSVMVDPGSSAVMLVSASGTKPLAYQWFHNSTPIAGATTYRYAVAGAGDSDTGVYHVQVSNIVTTVESRPAVLSLNPPVAPSITIQPEGRSIAAGNRLALNVGVAGSPPFSFTWRKDGVPLPGGTDARLNLTPVQPSHSGNYDVVIANVSGSLTSAPAPVSVFVLPFPQITAMQKMAAGVQIGWSNQPGSQFLIETSPDLNDWRPWVTSQSGDDHLWVMETNCSQPKLFYLARSILTVSLANFETYNPGAAVLFRNPTYSGTSLGYIDTAYPAYAYVTNGFPSGHASSRVLQVGWTFKAGTGAWLRLTATDGPVVSNPTVDLREGVQFDAWTDHPLYICLGLRETGTSAPIGANGSSTGPIEWVGGRTDNFGSPPKGVFVPSGTWTTLRFFFPYEPVKSMTGDNKLSSQTGKGVLEQLAIVPVDAAGGPHTLYLDNIQVIFIRP